MTHEPTMRENAMSQRIAELEKALDAICKEARKARPNADLIHSTCLAALGMDT